MTSNKKWTLEGLLDLHIKDMNVDNIPAIEWLQINSVLDEDANKLEKQDLLRLLNKAFLSIVILQKNGIKEMESEIDLLAKYKESMSQRMEDIKQNSELNELTSQVSFINGLKVSKTVQAKKAVKAKLANDPKQEEKSFVKECWVNWNKGDTHYKTKAAFARDMLDKCEYLISQKKIEDWCREWEKESSS